MNRTFAGDLHELCVLFCAQRSGQFDFNVDSVEHAFLGFAFLAVHGVDARVPQGNLDVFERQFFPARVETDGHRCADAKARQQIVVRIGAGIAAARAPRFICDKAMLTSDYFLFKAVGAAAHDDIGCLIAVLCTHSADQERSIPANASRYRQTKKTNKIVITVANGRPLGSIKM